VHPDPVKQRSPIAAGALLALLAAISFGLTTPVVAWAGRDLGPFTTGALLYGGAALSALALRLVGGRSTAPLRRSDAPRLGAVALAGAAIAPTLLAWGLQRAGATVGSLLLNLEAVFTVLLAHLIYREPIGRRVAVAVVLMVAGGAALASDAMTSSEWTLLGALAIAGATLAWATDNTLTRPLADRDPVEVVGAKASLGTACTVVAALVAGEPAPHATPALALLACGATGYGLSLRFYLLAQRRIGAARTGSVFALAPFIGAALAWVLGDRIAGPWTLAAAALFLVGVYLHVTEQHRHHHVHEALAHDHPHRHDDGHHDHVHDVPVAGEHAHPHRHAWLEHEHDHGPDLHHGHDH
jgi:drug/metabolite transporter (DMT)-like permease